MEMVTSGFAGPLLLLAAVVAVCVLAVLVLEKVFKALGWFFGRIFRFVGAQIGESLQFVGCTFTVLAFAPIIGLNVAFGRWSSARHYGRSLEQELRTAGVSLYRLALGNPLRLVGLSLLLDGVERRIPDAVAKAPGKDKPGKKMGSFPGYKVIGSLPTGGSGAKLFVAVPDKDKRQDYAARGAAEVAQVVIKSFSLYEDGTSLPQLVRESRALEAAKRLGLVLDHDLNEHRFYYVMPYVPGDDMGVIASRMHGQCGPKGLKGENLAAAMGYVADLLATLDRYHKGGLWHKDVKPDNIIVASGRAHLVDLGLVTPLRSAMTLTTHGTEYFRDPEMVKMAMRGAKVHEVDGVRFDLYGAGAVLFSVLENSFPAHGGLSTITKKCPEALRWIVRRSMADLSRRYGSASEMLADLRVVQRAKDPFKVKPAELPSVSGKPVEEDEAYVPPFLPVPPPATVVTAAADAEPEPTPAPKKKAGWFSAAGLSFSVPKPPPVPSTKSTAPPPIPASVPSRQPLRRFSTGKFRANLTRPNFGVFTGLLVAGMVGVLFLGAMFLSSGSVHRYEEPWASPSVQTRMIVSEDNGMMVYESRNLFDAVEVLRPTKYDEFERVNNRIPRIGEDYGRGTVVVIDRSRGKHRRHTADMVDDLVRSLDEDGFHVLSSRAMHEQSNCEMDLLAEAEYALGMGESLSHQAASKLRELFKDADEELDAVLWIQNGNHGHRLKSTLVVRPEFDSSWLWHNLLNRVQ